MVDTLLLSYTGRLGLVHRLVAMLQDDGTTHVSYQGPIEADGSSSDATETVLLAVQLAPRPQSLTQAKATVEEFLRRHQGVAVSVEELTASDPPHTTAVVAQLQSLARLHSDGQLTEEEFRRAKTRILGNG
jgi:hypothetical protein